MGNIKLTKTLTLSRCKDGFWLYDKTRGMNLAMKEVTEQEAFIEAISYYQNRCSRLEYENKKMSESIETFVSSISELDL